MTNRFKFRVWDKINGIWAKNFSIDEQGYVEGFYNPPQAMNRRLVLMQCTGLKDKNGKLIYEGDVIKETLTDFINEENIIVVKWDKLNAGYNLENLQNCEREVIGNIYENKFLLTEKRSDRAIVLKEPLQNIKYIICNNKYEPDQIII